MANSNPFQDSQRTKRIIFPNVSGILKYDRQDDDGVWRVIERLHSLFIARFSEPPRALTDVARTLIFTAQDRGLINDLLSIQRQDETIKRWIQAEIDNANHLIKVLVGGKTSSYPDVDGPSIPNEGGQYINYLSGLLSALQNRGMDTFLEDRFSIVAEVYYRNDQGRFARNLASQDQQNQPALEQVEKINFKDHPYGAIIILGHSPTKQEAAEGKALSKMCIDKIERSVKMNPNFSMAPLYFVCGGSVRPRNTPFNEATSMREYLIKQHDIPEERILSDTTSEHTYSNLMNAALLANQLQMPIGTKLISFMHQKGDQYEFTMDKLLDVADREVFPPVRSYLSIEDGPMERSVVVELIRDTEDFRGRVLLWRDYDKIE